ncbi:caspase family protein [Pantanalinema rosaneae CENA516]|uniref:nSTAND1 domain-containing NTPase n=1 Tax=Pantanalinema rosaneae TaxID=1620701 RepID=UPI003D6DAB13
MARYALVVGISDYQSSSRSLSKTVTDAQMVAQVLEQSNLFQKITRLTGTVTGNQLGQALQKLLLQQTSSNEALIYFTGHGMTATGYLQQQSGYLVTTDSTVEWQDHQVLEVRRGISLSDFNQLILGSNLNSLIVLLDCCHSGYFLERHCLVERLTAFSASKDYYFITACGSSEKTIARWREPHSVFTGALLKALSRDNADEIGLISGDRLFDCLSRELRQSDLEPLHLGWGQAITVVKYPVAPPASIPIPLVRRENPYVGLAAFDITQADYFYGRERAVRDLLDRLMKGRFLVVYGPSGCGKSSLIKAGLLPELQRDRLPGSREWDLECCTPGQTPAFVLEEILNRQHQRNQPFALFVDQFEELFTLCQEETLQRQFIHRLSEEINNPNARILIAIRGDFLDRCTQFIEVVKLINSTDPPSTYLVTPLTLAELEEAIEQPAARHGVAYEPGLVSQIAEDVVGQPGELPLLQYALTELWKQCIEKGDEQQLTQEGYRAIGRVQGALQQRAAQIYSDKEIFSDADRTLVRQLMMELVQLGEGQEVTRRRAEREQLQVLADSPEQLDRVVKQLADGRLIVTHEKTVEVAHEALLTEWTLLRQLIEQNREIIRLRRHLENDCQEWQEKGRSEGYLLAAGRLTAIEEWQKREHPRLSSMETEFVRKSQEKRDREQQAKLRRERRNWFLTAGLLCSITIFSLFSAQTAKKGEVETLVQLAENNFANHQQLEALVTSIKALSAAKDLFIDREQYLKRLQVIVYGVEERNRWIAHSDRIYTLSLNHNPPNRVNISSTYAAIASGGRDGTIELWNIKGESIKPLPQQEGYVWSLKFSHDGKLLASTGLGGKVKLWNVETGKLEAEFPGHGQVSYGVAFSSDDSMLASSGSDGKARFWRINKSKITKSNFLSPLSSSQANSEIKDIDFHPQRNIVAYTETIGKKDSNVWSYESGFPQRTPQKVGHHDAQDVQVKFSPDGNKIATSDSEGFIKVWSIQPVNPLKPLAVIHAHEQPVNGLGFSQDGTKLVSAGSDQTIKIWDLRKAIELYSKIGQPIQAISEQPEALLSTMRGHTADVNNAYFVFSKDWNTLKVKDDSFIVSASSDKTIRLWEWHPIDNKIYPISVGDLLKHGCQLIQQYTQPTSPFKLETEKLCS